MSLLIRLKHANHRLSCVGSQVAHLEESALLLLSYPLDGSPQLPPAELDCFKSLRAVSLSLHYRKQIGTACRCV